MISIRKCWEACCEPEIPNFFASAVVLHHQLSWSPSEHHINECWPPWVSPTPCTSGMDGTCCRLILLHRSELRSGSHTLGQTPEYQDPQKMTRKWFHPENTWEGTARLQEREADRAALMAHSKGALQSHSTAEQEASTGEAQRSPKRDERVETLLFNTHLVLKNRQSNVSTPHTVECQLHFLEKNQPKAQWIFLLIPISL